MSAEKTNIFLRNFDRMMQWIGNGANPAAIDAKLPLEKLVELILARESKPAYVRPAITQWMIRCMEYERFIKCSHLKGGRYRPKGGMRDYAVSFHTFINGESRIVCLLGCGFEVWNRPGWKYKWQYGLKMVEQSTNTATSSEVAINVPPFKRYRTLAPPPEFKFNDLCEKDNGCLDIGDANPIRGMDGLKKVNKQ